MTSWSTEEFESGM